MNADVSADDLWKVYSFPRMADEQLTSQLVRGAILSRAESGSVYWDAPNPRRSFVRGAVYDQRGRIVQMSQRKGGMNADMVLSVNPPVLSPREKDEAQAHAIAGHWLYAGSWMHGFGHFLVETLPTLWPLASADVDFDGICAHRFNSLRTHDWQFELVRLLSTNGSVEVIDDRPATIEQLTVPARAYHYQVAIDPIAQAVWDLIAERATIGAPAQHGRPVYLSRTRFQRDQASQGVMTGREFRNAEEVDALFENAGFHVVFPETLSATEQVRLARSASVLAGPSGSALHLSVFARPGARVIEVGDARTGASLVATQKAISSVKLQPTAKIPYVAGAGGEVDIRATSTMLDRLMS